MAKAKRKEVIKENQTLVVYTDGSAQPNPGYGGFGVFGYTFIESARPSRVNFPLKSTHVFTRRGIRPKEIPDPKYPKPKEGEKVKVPKIKLPNDDIEVVDVLEISGALYSDRSTNNRGELEAFYTGLMNGLTIDHVTHIHLITDSKYVLGGVGRIDKYRTNGWKNSQGDPLPNKDQWLKISDALYELEKANITISHEWVKGHEDDIGNNLADRLAVMGTNFAREQHKTVIEEEDFNMCCFRKRSNVADFKEVITDLHEVFEYKSCFFSSNYNDDNVVMLSSTKAKGSKDDDENDDVSVGKRDMNSIYAVLFNDTPYVIDSLASMFGKLERISPNPCKLDLDEIKRDKYVYRVGEEAGYSRLIRSGYNDAGYRYTLFDTDTVLVEDINEDYPFISDVLEVFERIIRVKEDLPKLLEEGHLREVTDYFIKEGDYILPHNLKRIDATEYLKDPNLQYVSIEELEFKRDLPSSTLMKKMSQDIDHIYIYPEILDTETQVTVYFIIEYHKENGEKCYLIQTHFLRKFLVRKIK